MIETEEHRVFRKSLRDLFERDIKPHVDEWEEAETFPAHELFPKLGAIGLLGLEYDEAYGGMAADHSFTVVAGEEMGRIDCGGVPMAIAVQMAMATPALARYGSHELKEQYLAPAIRGEMVASIAVTEADAGSDVAGIRTRAVRDGDEWVINGSKLYITNGTQADWLCLLARTERGRPPGHVAHRGAHRHRRRQRLAQAREAGHVVERHGRALVHRRPGPGRQHHRRDRPGIPTADGPVPGGAAHHPLPPHRLDRAGAQPNQRVPGASGSAFGQPLLANQHIQYVLAELSARHDMLKHYAYAAADGGRARARMRPASPPSAS